MHSQAPVWPAWRGCRSAEVDGVDQLAEQMAEVVVRRDCSRIGVVRVEPIEIVVFGHIEAGAEHETKIVDARNPCLMLLIGQLF